MSKLTLKLVKTASHMLRAFSSPDTNVSHSIPNELSRMRRYKSFADCDLFERLQRVDIKKRQETRQLLYKLSIRHPTKISEEYNTRTIFMAVEWLLDEKDDDEGVLNTIIARGLLHALYGIVSLSQEKRVDLLMLELSLRLEALQELSSAFERVTAHETKHTIYTARERRALFHAAVHLGRFDDVLRHAAHIDCASLGNMYITLLALIKSFASIVPSCQVRDLRYNRSLVQHTSLQVLDSSLSTTESKGLVHGMLRSQVGVKKTLSHIKYVEQLGAVMVMRSPSVLSSTNLVGIRVGDTIALQSSTTRDGVTQAEACMLKVIHDEVHDVVCWKGTYTTSQYRSVTLTDALPPAIVVVVQCDLSVILARD